MYIEPINKNQANQKDFIDHYNQPVSQKRKPEPQPENLDPEPKESFKALMQWQAPEFESIFKREKKWYMYLALILAAIIGYAIYTNSPLMAITFILIGILGYIYMNQEARIMDFGITEDGVIAGKEIYRFENITSFWIFYEPGEMKVISLKIKSSYLTPFVHIPVHDQDPVKIREQLMKFIPEDKQELSIIDYLERILGI